MKSPDMDETQAGSAVHDEGSSSEPGHLSEYEAQAQRADSESGDYLIPPPDEPDMDTDEPMRKRRWILWSLFGILILALIAGTSAFAGYNSAIDQRTRHMSTLVAGEASGQYILAEQDIALGNYDRARQRLEYIIQLDPNYPDVAEKLAFVLTQQRITATPTLAPTPTVSPTPDYRTRDELWTQAQNHMIGHEWTAAIDTMLILRKNYPDFMAVRVDGMLFVALRNRGIEKITMQRDLEGGNYDLTLAERFGPLDAEAHTWREWAELYIRGASFWGVDWAQSVYYFSQLASVVPNLSDLSGWTAANRYMDALLGYGNWFAAREEWCEAQEQFDLYMSMRADPEVEPTAVHVANQCAEGEAPPETPVGDITPTPSPTGNVPAPTETLQPQGTPYP